MAPGDPPGPGDPGAADSVGADDGDASWAPTPAGTPTVARAINRAAAELRARMGLLLRGLIGLEFTRRLGPDGPRRRRPRRDASSRREAPRRTGSALGSRR